MATIDDFIRPEEWISDFTKDMGKVIRDWGKDKFLPVRKQIDEDWKEHKIVEPLLKEVLVDLGINAAFFPAEAGGTDVADPATFSCVLADELGRLDSGFTTAVICSIWGMLPILLKPHRNMELCTEFGPKFCGDELYVGCNAMTEPQGGADIENLGVTHGKTIQTTARLQGGEWVINGHKIWPTNSGKVGDLYTVICTTKLGSDNEKDFALILVPADTPGVSVGGAYQKAGMAADMNSDIWFDNVRVPKRYRMHGPGDDAKYFREVITYGNLLTAAMCIGVMKNTYEIVKEWVSQRIILGKPMKEHSINAAVLSEIAVDIEATSAWVYTYARETDFPEIYGVRPWEEEMQYKTRGVSLFGSDAAVHATGRAMELMGSYGYTRDYDLEKHWRDVKMTTLWMGGRNLRILENARYWYDIQTI